MDILLSKVDDRHKSNHLIVQLKYISHSVKPGMIKNSIELFDTLKKIYDQLSDILPKINLSNEAISYYGKLVIKYQVNQLHQLAGDTKRYLYLICFVIHQYKCWQDTLITIFKKIIRSFHNKANKSKEASHIDNVTTKNEHISNVSIGYNQYRSTLMSIEKDVKDKTIDDQVFRESVAKAIDSLNNKNIDKCSDSMNSLLDIIDVETKGSTYYHKMDEFSRKLQTRVAELIKRLDFIFESNCKDLEEAVEFYCSDMSITKVSAPDSFLDDISYEHIYNSDYFNISLYKSILYIKLYEAVNNAQVSLKNSYKYLPIKHYMIDDDSWHKNKDAIIERLGLEPFKDIDKLLIELQARLDKQYYNVNERIATGENTYIHFNSKKDDNLIVYTPKLEKPNYQSIGNYIGDQNIPILKLLTNLNKLSRFTSPLTHYKVKSKVKFPEDELFIAGIFALGSDIGLSQLAKSSIGIEYNKLSNAVKWYFEVENLNAINNLLTDFMNKMSLPDLFRKEKNFLHTSTDGRKRCISVESLLANYSYKYFGHGKGINIYLFVDERGILFNSTVFSSSDRDAPYVIDSLLHNDGIKSDMHSTDTHGYTESIFAISHLLGTTFAPRIAKLYKQTLYSFESIRDSLIEKEYKILPKYVINKKLIKDHWDMILRLVASIKNRDVKASTILKRLSSYDHKPELQKAIQEFGKIIKSIFILNYIDDLDLRQSIQKQLNKSELANRFAKAVSFAPNQEISQIGQEDQEKAAICKMIIQNAIILWNYIELTKLLMNESDEEKRKQIIEDIKESSILTWKHVNMLGIYDFSRLSISNDQTINAREILEYNAA